MITGAIKLIDIPDDSCISTVRDLYRSLEKHLAVELDAEKITNVSVSISEPDNVDGNNVWFRLDTSGNFLGIYVYIQGQWLQMFPPPNSVIRMYGDSRDIPEGFQLITNDTPGFSTAMVTKLQSQWERDVSNNYWLIFDVVYVGL